MRSIGIFALVTGVLAAATAQAGVMHPALLVKLDQVGPQEPVSVIVHLAEQAPIGQLDVDLRVRGATRQERHREIVLALQEAARSQEALRSYLDGAMRSGGVRGYTGYWISNLVVVQAIRSEIEIIAARMDVQGVELNFKPELIGPVNPEDRLRGEATTSRGIGIPPGIEAIRAPQVWHELGITGAGRLIGSCDTGVDGNHPALQSRWRGNNGHPWEECWLDVLGGTTTYPNDSGSHGTHVTGTMTGLAPDDSIGVAPGALWIATNAIGQGVSSEFDNDIIAVYQWFADPDGDPGTVDDVPDVVQNSWGVYEGLGYPDCYTLWWSVIDNCEAAGVVTCWSAGNEGPGAGTLRSPADRATTTTNCFSVGAVDATHYDWPYPIAGFSSRGPTMCDVPPENEIKPEVAAPGVEVYSSVPGGGYQQVGWDGTSMAGPHAAGIVALMRQGNPDLDVRTIKLILMQTARDEGTTGEDNTFGHGFVDAHAAVTVAIEGFGQMQGYVYNASYSNSPIPGATVELLGSDYLFVTREDGSYSGWATPGNYTARAGAPGFDTQDVGVEIVHDVVTVQDFYLNDIAGPVITDVSQPVATPDTIGPYAITAEVNDPSTVAEVKLIHRVNLGGWQETAMTLSRDQYAASLPGASTYSRIDFYVRAEDGVQHVTFDPPGAPWQFYSLYITDEMYVYDVEDPEDPDWQLGVPGDEADSGIWVREDPVGTDYYGLNVQPEDDHTADPGITCFVTGNANPGDPAGTDDVDHGCTTLMSPVFALSAFERGFASYWRWYGEGGNSIDDEFAVDISDDGGNTWVALERVPENQNSWQRVAFDLAEFVDLTDQVVFRFVACDLNVQGLVEAGVDDFSITVWTTSDIGGEPTTTMRVFSLSQNLPNPFNPVTTIGFDLPQTQAVKLAVYSVEGRSVATLVDEELPAGPYRVIWDGRDQRGVPVTSGIYFYRLEAGGNVETRRMVLLK